MSWPAGVCSGCPVQSAGATIYLNQQVTMESLHVPLGPRPCSHSAECLAEGHGPETDKYRTINGTMGSGREEPGAETAGTRSPKLAGGSKELWRQLWSLVVGGLWALWEGEAVQPEETTPVSMWCCHQQATNDPSWVQGRE